MARGFKVTKAKMQEVCDELAKGKSLRSVCDKGENMPHWVTVLKAVQRDEDLFEMYSRARAIGAEVLADEMHDLAASPLPANMDPRLANAEVQRRRVEIDTKKWTFSKMQPRGVRHKQEDVQDQGGQVTLVWGAIDPPAEQEQGSEPADVIKLVADDSPEQ